MKSVCKALIKTAENRNRNKNSLCAASSSAIFCRRQIEKSLCKVPLAKSVSVGADFAGRFVFHANLDRTANRFNFPAAPRWAPQGNQNHIGFCRGCHCFTVMQSEEFLPRAAFGSPHRKPPCYYNMPENHKKSNLKGQKSAFCNIKRLVSLKCKENRKKLSQSLRNAHSAHFLCRTSPV